MIQYYNFYSLLVPKIRILGYFATTFTLSCLVIRINFISIDLMAGY